MIRKGSFILTKWYVKIIINNYIYISNYGFILTKWYVKYNANWYWHEGVRVLY
ncbi:hypothetical protein QEW_3595 [Clostridioides difficile CD160]|nr:hypothetical protein QEW_3595 [Clostridioides difficile CD160]